MTDWFIWNSRSGALIYGRNSAIRVEADTDCKEPEGTSGAAEWPVSSLQWGWRDLLKLSKLWVYNRLATKIYFIDVNTKDQTMQPLEDVLEHGSESLWHTHTDCCHTWPIHSSRSGPRIKKPAASTSYFLRYLLFGPKVLCVRKHCFVERFTWRNRQNQYASYE